MCAPGRKPAQLTDSSSSSLLVSAPFVYTKRRVTHSFSFASFLTTGFFSSLTFVLPLAAAPFVFFASGLSSSLSLLSSFFTFFALLVDALALAAAFFFANGFSSSDDSSSLSSLYFGLAFERAPALVLPFDLRDARGFLADNGVSSSDNSEPEGVDGFWTRRG